MRSSPRTTTTTTTQSPLDNTPGGGIVSCCTEVGDQRAGETTLTAVTLAGGKPRDPQPPESKLDKLDDWIRSINKKNLPGWIFLGCVIVLAIVAFALGPNLLIQWWHVDSDWKLFGRLALAAFAAPAVAALFGLINLCLTLLGSEALRVQVPTLPWRWLRPANGLPLWLGLGAVLAGTIVSTFWFT